MKLGLIFKHILLESNLPAIIKTIPKEIINAIDSFNKTRQLTIIDYPDGIKTYIYNDYLNKFPTSAQKYPKAIFINLDHLSDVPYVILGITGKNMYINVYYAFLHELNHLETNLPIESMPDLDFDKYMNSENEKQAMEASDKWLRAIINL
jgi:hypothetical protein